MPESVKVFVSHSSKDRSFTQQLVSDLKSAGAEVWWDVTGINEGDFLKKINEALQQCDWFILVLTPDAIKSDYVTMEVNAAIVRHKNGFIRGLFPVLATPCELGAIPPLWDHLHRFDATQDYPAALRELLQALNLNSQISAEIPIRAVTEVELSEAKGLFDQIIKVERDSSGQISALIVELVGIVGHFDQTLCTYRLRLTFEDYPKHPPTAWVLDLPDPQIRHLNIFWGNQHARPPRPPRVEYRHFGFRRYWARLPAESRALFPCVAMLKLMLNRENPNSVGRA